MGSSNQQVRVRFAPSPTGYLHIGSARTAFFNWLFARKTGGNLILRIEDTDMARHMEESLNSLTSSLKWLGISWDEGYDAEGAFGPYRQSQRKDIYQQYSHTLIAQGKAYPCFCSPESLKVQRQDLEKQGKTFKYDRKCLSLDPGQAAANISQGMPYAVRLRLPDSQTISFKDTVYGDISVNTDNLDDFVILRSNGLPTYNFSAAVDDALMKITHVIRGEDHLSNTPKQILVYMMLGFDLPQFTHLPMILGSDGHKLSKRHGSVSIEAYQEQGILPEAILNYLALLGWTPPREQDIFSIQQLIDLFEIEDINKKPARFDFEKLLWVNSNWIRSMETGQLAEFIVKEVKQKIDKPAALNNWEKDLNLKSEAIAPLIRERIKTLSETMDWIRPFFEKVSYSQEAMAFFDLKKVDAAQVLKATLAMLDSLTDFNSGQIETSLRQKAQELEVGFRNFMAVIRVALWGTNISPPLFKTMEILGKDLTTYRLSQYLETLASRS